jgi:hypothetical protein
MYEPPRLPPNVNLIVRAIKVLNQANLVVLRLNELRHITYRSGIPGNVGEM